MSVSLQIEEEPNCHFEHPPANCHGWNAVLQKASCRHRDLRFSLVLHTLALRCTMRVSLQIKRRPSFAVTRIRRMTARSVLFFSVPKSELDNVYCDSHSVNDGIMLASGTIIGEKRALACGYGDVGPCGNHGARSVLQSLQHAA